MMAPAEPLRITTPVVVLVGPTAVGKTALSLQIATEFGCEIISMDSMQVYRGMDIGTAKATPEERRQVVHHLIDIRDPDEQYHAASFVTDTLAAIRAIGERGHIPLITGGTGLYLSSLLHGLFDTVEDTEAIRAVLQERLRGEGREVLHGELQRVDPTSAARIHPNDTQRLLRGLEIFHATGLPWSEHLQRQRQAAPPPQFSRLLLLGLRCDRDLLVERISRRSRQMMGDAFAAEVTGLLAQGYGADLPSLQAIGYRHMIACLAGTMDRETATRALIADTRRYAKRQMTWFRRYADLHWHDLGQLDAALVEVTEFFRTNRQK
jgi:tRNA dimethylallyltransferase